jgi:hypothetical protein
VLAVAVLVVATCGGLIDRRSSVQVKQRLLRLLLLLALIRSTMRFTEEQQ